MDYIDEGKAFEAFDHYALNKACIAQVMENSGSRASVELIDSESDGKETINSLLLQELCSEAKLTPVLSEVSFLYRVGRERGKERREREREERGREMEGGKEGRERRDGECERVGGREREGRRKRERGREMEEEWRE